MPRKAPDSVQEHRITFGNAERALIKSTSNKIALAEVTKGVGTAIGGIGALGAGIGLLIWAGFNLEDSIDNWSTKLTSWVEKKGWVVYHAPVYGEKLKEVRAEMELLFIENATVADPNHIGYNRARADAIAARMQVLTKRDAVLVSIIADIAAGRRKGYGWVGGMFSQFLSKAYNDEFFEIYGYYPSDTYSHESAEQVKFWFEGDADPDKDYDETKGVKG